MPLYRFDKVPASLLLRMLTVNGTGSFIKRNETKISYAVDYVAPYLRSNIAYTIGLLNFLDDKYKKKFIKSNLLDLLNIEKRIGNSKFMNDFYFQYLNTWRRNSNYDKSIAAAIHECIIKGSNDSEYDYNNYAKISKLRNDYIRNESTVYKTNNYNDITNKKKFLPKLNSESDIDINDFYIPFHDIVKAFIRMDDDIISSSMYISRNLLNNVFIDFNYLIDNINRDQQCIEIMKLIKGRLNNTRPLSGVIKTKYSDNTILLNYGEFDPKRKKLAFNFDIEFSNNYMNGKGNYYWTGKDFTLVQGLTLYNYFKTNYKNKDSVRRALINLLNKDESILPFIYPYTKMIDKTFSLDFSELYWDNVRKMLFKKQFLQ